MEVFSHFKHLQRMGQKKKVEMDLRLWSVFSILSIQKNQMEDSKILLVKDRTLEQLLTLVPLQLPLKSLHSIMENVYHPSEKCRALFQHLVHPPAQHPQWSGNTQQIFHLILKTMDTHQHTIKSQLRKVEAKGMMK